MMTAMARLPCKQTSPSQQPRYAGAPQPQQAQSPSYVQSRGYWEMQQPMAYQAPPYVRSHHRHHADHVGKRKSAVELLQESKAFYVKSETVLDRKQELKNSGHLQVSQVTAPSAPPRLLRKCGSQTTCGGQQQQQHQPSQQQSPPCCWAVCHENERPLPPKSPRLVPVPQRRSSSNSGSNHHSGGVGGPGGCGGGGPGGSEQLQAKLRRLLNTDSKENVFFPEVPPPPPPAEYATPGQTVGLSNGCCDSRGGPQSQQPPSWEDKFRYSPGGSLSPGCRDDERTWAAERGGEVRFKFGRSNSHSHGGTAGSGGRGSRSGRSSSGHGAHGGSASSAIETIGQGPVVCHKSLPDLHTSTRRRASLSPRASTKSTSRQQLQQLAQQAGCPDCETGSDYSDRSFNRDSTRYRSGKRSSSRHIRRSMGSGGGDASSVLSSGGRTQKSSGSSKLSHGATARDSGGSSGHCTHRSEPPPRIQDHWSHARRDSGASTQHSTERDNRSRKSSNYNNGTPPPAIIRHYSPDTDSSNSQTDYSPTCNSRFSDGWKEGRGRPILRSKSDISDRYWRHESGAVVGSGGGNVGSSGGASGRSQMMAAPRPPRSMTQLESFFDRLGLDPDTYQHVTEPSSKTSSPVFFDSVSSVESIPAWAANNSASQQWQNNCCTGMGNNIDECVIPGQRTGDPPSIVERNARIIKWLCQCRKVQFGYS